jgi:FkbM family methyltransferase
LVVGLPIVTRDGCVFRSRQSKAMLEEVGLGDWVCADNTLYVNRAIKLARDPGLRTSERDRIERIRGAGLKLLDTAPYAVMQMNAYDRIIADWNAGVEALHTLDAGALAQRISALASQKARRGGVFTDRDLVLQVVLPYLRNGGTRRLIEVGAFTGGMSKPFLQEGWQAVLFEADERCHKPLAALVETHRGRVRLEKAAVTPDHDGSIAFHLAGIPGLSGLTRSPFVNETQTVDVRSVALARYIAAKGLFDLDFINIDAAGHDFAILNSIDFQKVTPRLVMVGFAEEFAGEDRTAIEAALRGMRARGYRACVVCLQTFGHFKRHDWPKNLLAIGIDAVPQVPPGSSVFGNVLFFREDDRDFLPSLCDWLEQPLDWERRGLTRA